MRGNPEIQQITPTEGKGLRQLMGELAAALDESDRLMRAYERDREDAAVGRRNEKYILEAEGDATGEP